MYIIYIYIIHAYMSALIYLNPRIGSERYLVLDFTYVTIPNTQCPIPNTLARDFFDS